MSSTTKIIIALVVVIILGLGIWGYMDKKAPVVPGTPNNSGGEPINAVVGVTAQNSTDASLDSDMANIDASMKALENDSASADQSLNDKPVSQAE